MATKRVRIVSDSEELVDFYDTAGNVIGFCTRHEADQKNYTYPNVIIFVFTSDRHVWIQKRSITKRHYPGLWDPSACGALAHEENPKVAAERELTEEMSLKCKLIFVEKFLNSFPGEGEQLERHRMSYLYIGISDNSPKPNHEVEAVAAFAVDELLKETGLRPKDFVPSFDIEFEKALKAYELLLTA